jgi:hypothetical protein
MRTNLRLRIAAAVSVIPLLSVVALAQDSYDYRRGVNFGAIRTFAFKATPAMEPTLEKTTNYDSPLVRERTEDAIAAQLQARGMRRDDQHPDVYVVTHRTYKVEYTYYNTGWGGWDGWGPYGWAGYYNWGPWYNSTYVYPELRGTLTVDLQDAKSGALLWRGIETKHVHESSKPSKRDKRVNDEVEDVFKHFPTIPGAVATSGER